MNAHGANVVSNVPMTLPQLMLAEHNTPFFHSSFLELDDGRILHVGVGMSNYSQDGGLTWSKAEQMQDINGNQVGASETSLVKLSDKGAIGLAARITCEPGVRGDAAWPLPPRDRYMAFWRSDDTGQTWQPPVRISAPGTRTAGYHDNFLRTSSGRIVLPVYHMLGQKSNLNDGPPPMYGKLVCNQFVPTRAELVRRGVADNNSIRQKQKVLPLKWFYGGKEPANNPFLQEAYEPAKP